MLLTSVTSGALATYEELTVLPVFQSSITTLLMTMSSVVTAAPVPVLSVFTTCVLPASLMSGSLMVALFPYTPPTVGSTAALESVLFDPELLLQPVMNNAGTRSSAAAAVVRRTVVLRSENGS